MGRADSDTSAAPSDYLELTAEVVRDHLAAATPLEAFLEGAGTLTLDQRMLLVDQALVLLEQNYVHLPLKIAMHAVNPVQRLRLIRRQLEQQTPATMPPEWIFHAEMSKVFHSVRDLHTNYQLPAPFANKIAFLPFLVEETGDGPDPRFLVTLVMPGVSAPGFEPGAEITHWSGVPIEQAVELNAGRFAGGNAAARRSRGIESLTLRSLSAHLPPFEEWVTVSYVGTDGEEHELRFFWQIVDSFEGREGPEGEEARVLGVDYEAEEIGRAKVMLFVPHVIEQQQALAAGQAPRSAAGEVASTMPEVFTARSVETPSGTFGHIRIHTFWVRNSSAFVAEFVRLIGILPQNGLIVDVRDNGGGSVWASELTLQTLTARHITPEPFQFINTPLNLRICRSSGDLEPWVPSMEQAVETGAAFSAALPLTPEDRANQIGQQYFGPVVLITNARCYSATDMFAAGFQDHRIGIVLGTDDNTGAGGANVWQQGDFLSDFPLTASPYRPLPNGAGMRVSIRRSLRVGDRSGTPLEDLGVVPDERHRMTRRDLLEGNVDLLARAGELLAAQPVRELNIADVARADGSLRLKVRTSNIDRVDVYLDRRPGASVDVPDGQAEVTVTGATAARAVRVEGYAVGELVASRTMPL
ncbi:S41 family peptidase [Streptomyces sp. IMTB 1903]|uniref:S41 family peptidase n=1 Tax=Streptomyces sp. IMTB 1903 TaxID=1776680 RepID=UPI00075669AC|nr:S41 family peptidase [Streptomyces sp. IMTB 1903]